MDDCLFCNPDPMHIIMSDGHLFRSLVVVWAHRLVQVRVVPWAHIGKFDELGSEELESRVSGAMRRETERLIGLMRRGRPFFRDDEHPELTAPDEVAPDPSLIGSTLGHLSWDIPHLSAGRPGPHQTTGTLVRGTNTATIARIVGYYQFGQWDHS